MGSNWRKKLLLSLAFGALVFIALTVYADIDGLVAAFAEFNWWFAPVILCCTLLNYVFRYWKWEFYTVTLDIQPTRKDNLIIFFSAFIMAVTPGKLGEVLKSYLLKQVNGTPISRSAPIVVAERLTDFIGLVLLLVVGAYVFDISRGIVIAFAVFFALLTILLAWRRGSIAVIELFGRLPFLRRFLDNARSAYDSMYIMLRPRPLLVSIILSVIAWFFECFGYYIVLSVFETPPTMLKATFIYAFSTIVGAVSMLPGGLGTTEGSLTGLVQLAGASKEVAVASTFIIRSATLWFAVIIGVVVTLAFQHRLPVNLDEIPLEDLAS
ncbi:MAG: flippase-like domain-containing protein [Bacteroidetes bacterium]|nr:flippase-like domain-containing protein [Bacteroidota bacterium]